MGDEDLDDTYLDELEHRSGGAREWDNSEGDR